MKICASPTNRQKNCNAAIGKITEGLRKSSERFLIKDINDKVQFIARDFK